MARKTLVLTLVLALVAAAGASAEPWEGDRSVVSPLEATASAWATKVAGRPASVVCNSQDEWARLLAEGRVGPTSAFVDWVWDPAGRWVPSNVAEVSPDTCLALEAFRVAPDKAAVTTRCQTGTTTAYVLKTVRVRLARRVNVKGRWVRRMVWVKRERLVQVPARPTHGDCADLFQTLWALDVVGHEAVHITGQLDEGLTECYAMQRFAQAAEHFGATPNFARRLASIFWRRIYPLVSPAYRRSDCVNGGPLDINPTSDVWP